MKARLTGAFEVADQSKADITLGKGSFNNNSEQLAKMRLGTSNHLLTPTSPNHKVMGLKLERFLLKGIEKVILMRTILT